MKILYINTSGDNAQIGLITESQASFSKFKSQNRLSDFLLGKIQKLLLKNKTDMKKLDAIAVFKGPGSFTGLRIGIATANALAFSLNIPQIEISGSEQKDLPSTLQNKALGLAEIIRKKFQKKFFKKIVVPFYGKPPNITKPKK